MFLQVSWNFRAIDNLKIILVFRVRSGQQDPASAVQKHRFFRFVD